MAKTQQSSTPVTPDFKDVDKESVQRAQSAIQGGARNPLKVPKTAKVSKDKKGVEYSRWTERAVVTQAYRTVTASGLMDVTVVAKIRQSKGNNGERAFGHFYLNLSEKLAEGHEFMNDRSNGAIISLLTAVPETRASAANGLKAAVLNKMFPKQNAPGAASPLADKAVVLNVVQEFGPAKDRKTKKVLTDDKGNVIMERRDRIESFLPDAATEPAETESEGDEDEE